MALARKIAYNVAISSVAKVVSTVLALAAIGFITRYLGKEGFGDYSTVLAFLSFFASLADLGLYHISTREISRPEAPEEKIIGNIFSLRLIASIGILALSPLIVLFLPYSSQVNHGILIIALSLLFSSSYQVLNGVFQKRLAMDKVAIAELAGKVAQVGVIIIAATRQWSFEWIVSAVLFNMVVSFVIAFLWSRRYLKFSLQFDFSYWKSFLKESLPMGAAAVITFLYFKMDTILLSIMRSSSDVGIYNASYKVVENLNFFPAMIVGLVMPIMSRTVFHDWKKFEIVSNHTLKLFVILTVPLVIGTLFLSDGIVYLIGGDKFAESAEVLRILIFALVCMFFGHFFNATLIAGNLQRTLMFIFAFAAGFNVISNLIVIPVFSYIGAAYISVITELAVVALSVYFAKARLGYSPKIEKTGQIFLSGAIMAAFLFIFQGRLGFFFLALGSAMVYLFCLWILRAVKTSEILSLISKKGVKEYEELA